MRGNPPARAAEDHQIAITSLAPLEPRTTIEHGTHFEGESRPSQDSLASNPEVAAAEPQLNHNGRLDNVYQRGSGKGFMRSLPESRSA
jgi:hypothetical protein